MLLSLEPVVERSDFDNLTKVLIATMKIHKRVGEIELGMKLVSFGAGNRSILFQMKLVVLIALFNFLIYEM